MFEKIGDRVVLREEPRSKERYETIWIVLSADDNSEGIIVVPMSGVSMPLVTGELEMVPTLEKMAREFCATMGSTKTVRVAEFKRV